MALRSTVPWEGRQPDAEGPHEGTERYFPLHHTYKEVKYGHVNDVEQPIAVAVGVDLPHRVAVERIHFPPAGDGGEVGDALSGCCCRGPTAPQSWSPVQRWRAGGLKSPSLCMQETGSRTQSMPRH